MEIFLGVPFGSNNSHMADALFCFVSDVAMALTSSSSVRELCICISSFPAGELVLKPVPISGHQSKTHHLTSQFSCMALVDGRDVFLGPVRWYLKLRKKKASAKN